MKSNYENVMKRLNQSLDYYDNKLNSFKQNIDSEFKQVNELKDAIDSLSCKLNGQNKSVQNQPIKKNSDTDENYLTFNVRDDNGNNRSDNLNSDEINFINSATARTRYVQNLKIDDLVESNFNSVIKNTNVSDKIIGNLTKSNNDVRFKIEELENFALRIYNELPNHNFVQKISKEILVMKQNMIS